MRDLLILLMAYMTRPVPWFLPRDLTLPFAVWVVAFIVSTATLIWMIRRAIRIVRGR